MGSENFDKGRALRSHYLGIDTEKWARVIKESGARVE